MHKYEYLISPEIAKLESNKSLIPSFSLGPSVYPLSVPDSSPIQISFNVNKHIFRPSDVTNKLHWYYGKDKNDELYYSSSPLAVEVSRI